MRLVRSSAWLLVLGLLSSPALAPAQTSLRRLTTIDALRQFPGYYHLENVLLRGEFSEEGSRIVFRAADQEIRVVLTDQVRTETGPVEVRGQLIDIGRLEPGDPRVPQDAVPHDAELWPRPGEELVLRVTGVIEAQPPGSASVRALALEPWRFVGQEVTLVGQFRGRNILGDLPASPAKGRYDFVLRSADGAVWVTGLRPRGRDLDLSVDARVDTDRWIRVTGTVAHDRGFVMIEGTAIAAATAPSDQPTSHEPDTPPPPALPVDVVFSSPTPDETDVPPSTSVRVQFSRGLDPNSIDGQIRVGYVGTEAGSAPPEFTHRYDAANRAVEIKFTTPLSPFRTMKVELLDGIKSFDGAPFVPWSLTFSVGS